MRDVTYNYGFLTTGQDNWIIHGIELKKIDATIAGIPFVEPKGQMMVELKKWKSIHGLLASWKLHTLREEDANRDTVIVVYASTVEFKSMSGNSSTDWVHEYDITKLVRFKYF
jgi:hypothetical protein